MSYYYFAATLPMLAMDQPPPFSVEEFRQQCAVHLSAQDRVAMQELLEDAAAPRTSHPFIRRWREEDGRLRNTLARTRAERLNKDARAYIRDIPGFDAALEREVSDAYSRPTPLEREKAIDRIRWRRLEAMVGLDPFTTEAVLAYGLQLAIQERWARLDKDAGSTTVESLVNRNPADEEDKS